MEGICYTIACVLIVLKLCGQIDISWAAATVPIWVLWAGCYGFIALLHIWDAIDKWFEKHIYF